MQHIRPVKPIQPPNTSLRITIVGLTLAVALVVISVQLVRVQLFQQDWLSEQAANRYRGAVTLSASRGDIYDAQGRKMAISTQVGAIGVHPRLLEQPEQYATALAGVLDLTPQTLTAHLASDKNFVWIKRQVNPREMQAVRNLQLDGLVFTSEPRRFYPHKELAAQVLGFCGIDGNGLEGLEHFYNTELQGRHARLEILRDARGRGFDGTWRDEALTRGADLVLTLDATIQHIAESALEEAVRENEAVSGMVVVMCPQTGAIRALAHYPTFNPNSFGTADGEQRRNRAVTDVFEPGSTMKIFTAAAALESGLSSPDSQFFCENGRYAIGRNTIRDVKPHQWLTLEQIVHKSSNIGAAKVGETIGDQRLYEMLVNFGFGERTQVDSPGEVAGSLSHYRRWSRIDAAAIAFGQGIAVTAIQLTAATAAIANGGLLMQPYLVARIIDQEGYPVRQTSPVVVRRVLRSETASALNRMMQTVTAAEGTGIRAALPEYPVAGKTGTAQKVSDGRYVDGKYLSSFVGFVPANNPALVILAIVDEPLRQHYGGAVAAPLFRRVAKDALNYLNIAPVHQPHQMAAHEEAESSRLKAQSSQGDRGTTKLSLDVHLLAGRKGT